MSQMSLQPAAEDRAADHSETAEAGFSLLELMVVVVILSVLALVIVPRVIDRPDQARMVRARTDLGAISSAVKFYRLDNFRYPSTEEGIDALVNKPNDPDIKWPEGGYIPRLPRDPWNRPYLYLQPGNNGEYDLYTFGRDGEQGGEGPDSDIGNWSLN